MARAMWGWPWPCVVTHQDEIASRRTRPSSVVRRAPSARAMASAGPASACCVKGCQMGERSGDIGGLEIARIEMGRESRAQAFGRGHGKERQPPEAFDLGEADDGCFRIRHGVSDEDDALHT